MSEPNEVPIDLEAYGLLAWLYMELRFNGKITVDTWNKAIEKTTNRKPPAASTAEGKFRNLTGQIGSGEGVPIMEADPDATADGEGIQVSVGVFDGDGRELVVLQRIENTLAGIRQLVSGQVVRRSGVTDVSHDVSLSVGGAPSGAGVGTSESTERVYTAYGPIQGKPPAGATAEGDETNNQR